MTDRNQKGIRYRLYARKSTDSEDRQVQSLGDQEKDMIATAKREGIRIIGEPLRESKSAKRPYSRPFFDELLREIEDGKIDGIVCWKLDRLSRNPTDSGRIQQLLQDGKLKHILTNDKSYYPEDNAIVFSVEAGMSNQYIRELASNTKRGMKSKAEKGDKPGIPPIGYLNDKANKVIMTDPDRFDSIRILWDKMLTGTYSVAQIKVIADKELHILSVKRQRLGGKPIAYSTLFNMFRNPFYAGILVFNGQEYQGNHTAMITAEEFEAVQQIIDPSHTTRPKDKSYNFQLRNLFRCGECGFAITAEEKRKTLKSTGEIKSYTYYHCTGKSRVVNCSQRHQHVSEKELLQQLKEKLTKFTIHPKFYKLAIEALAQEEDEVVTKVQFQTEARDRAIEKKKQAITSLRRMRYNGEADDDSWYYSEIQTLEDELETLQNQRNNAEYKARDWRAKADEVFTFARYAKEDFDSGDLEKKRSVIVRLGEVLTVIDRTIQFAPNKYLIPLEKMNESSLRLPDMVRTDSQQREIGSNDHEITSWLPLVDVLRNYSVNSEPSHELSCYELSFLNR